MLSIENESIVGGMLLIPQKNGQHWLINDEINESLILPTPSQRIASRMKIRRSGPPREVSLSCNESSTLSFDFNRESNSFARFAAARSEAEEKIPKRPKVSLVP